MKIKKVLLLALVLVCCLPATGALGESRYDALCAARQVSGPHVTAWLEIPGFAFCQPVMQHPQNDAFYAKHDAAGAETDFGMMYTQATYNKPDFNDPVTIVYGSSTTEGTVLRDLQENYSGGFDEGRKVLLHLPGETREYLVFAALPYSAVHILHYYDFSVEKRFISFFDGIFSSRVLGMHLATADAPVPGEKVLILSTGLRGDRLQRFLVMAKLVNK